MFNSYSAPDAAAYIRMAFATVAGQTIAVLTAVGLLVLMLGGLWLYTFTLTGSLPGLTHGKALILNVCGSSVGNLMPAGGAAGVATTYALCRSWGFSRRGISNGPSGSAGRDTTNPGLQPPDLNSTGRRSCS